MSKNYCKDKSSCCNNNCCNPCDGYGNSGFGPNGSLFYTLAVLLIFGGGGFGPASFWGDYGNAFTCSGFNNAWCTNIGSNNSFNNTSPSSNANNFSGNNISNSNVSNTNLAALLGGLSGGLFGGLSGDNNLDTGNLTDSSN